MAEKGAFLTQPVQNKPSIFDFIAQESLNELLQPSAKRVVDVLSFRYPIFQSVFKYFDEYFLITHCLLQYHYLKKYGGTFAESFYGLQRVPLKGGRLKLNDKELLLSVLLVCLFPYLKGKLQQKAEVMYLDMIPNETNERKIKLMKAFISLNSGFQISVQLIKFVQHLRFLSGKSDVSCPLLWAAGVKLQYVSDVDLTQDVFSWRDLVPQMLRRSLEVGAFFLQFYQWWQTEHVGSFGDLPIPPAPESKTGDLESCPICHERRHIDTALAVSGVVYCFSCISDHLKANQYCPVTRLPATLDQLIRIYPPQ